MSEREFINGKPVVRLELIDPDRGAVPQNYRLLIGEQDITNITSYVKIELGASLSPKIHLELIGPTEVTALGDILLEWREEQAR